MKNLKRNSKGFTLVEIMVAVAVMGGLSVAIMQMTKNATKTSAKFQQDVDVTGIINEISTTLFDPSSCGVNFNGYTPTSGTITADSKTALNKKLVRCLKRTAAGASGDTRQACSVAGDGATLMNRSQTDALLSDTTGTADCKNDTTHAFCWIYNGNKEPYKSKGFGNTGLIVNDYYLANNDATNKTIELVVEFKKLNSLKTLNGNGGLVNPADLTFTKKILLSYSTGAGTTITYCRASVSGYSEIWSRVSGAQDIFYSTGNVGIGNAGPLARLHVTSTATGGMPATTGTAQTAAGWVSRHDNSTYTLDTGIGASGEQWMQATNITNLATNYSMLLNPNGGNVGINTTAPASALHVQGNAQLGTNGTADRSLTIHSGTAGQNLLLTNTAGFAQVNAVGGNLTVSSSSGYINLQTGGGEKVRLDTAGRLGIGTTTPGTPLEISSATDSIMRLRQQGGGWNYVEYYNDTARTSYVGMQTDSLYTINGQIFLNTTNGFVGVGISGPSSKLHVDSGDLRITNGFGILAQSPTALGAMAASYSGSDDDHRIINKAYLNNILTANFSGLLTTAQKEAIVNNILNSINSGAYGQYNVLRDNITTYALGNITETTVGGANTCGANAFIDGIDYVATGTTAQIRYHCTVNSSAPDCRIAGNCNKLYVDGAAGNGYCMVGTARCLTNGSNAYWGGCNWASAFGYGQYYQISSGWYNHMCPPNYFQVGRRVVLGTACTGVTYTPASGYSAASASCSGSIQVVSQDEPYCCPARIF